MAIAPKIANFIAGRAIVDDRGNPTNEFLQKINGNFASLQAAQAATAAALAAAGIATAAAAAANAAADAVTSEASLVNSFIVAGSFTPPLISANSGGDVIIATHDRQYGDPALNPTVTVNGDTLLAVGGTPDVVRIHYLDPSRAGGTVAYLYTIDPDPQPVQGNDDHSVGAVTIPGAGTQSGNYVQPPGTVAP